MEGEIIEEVKIFVDYFWKLFRVFMNNEVVDLLVFKGVGNLLFFYC